MIVLKRTRYNDPHFEALIVDLDKEFWIRYPDTQQNFDPYNKVDDDARVVLAYSENTPVGCGCFRPILEHAILEIKRMFVVPQVRGKGIARLILRELEKWGREEGFTESKLETGIKQPEAIAVYRSAGYREIPNYPPYTEIAESICMAKILA
jgi:GNAT superfamily N-acetyltransferase